MLPMASTFGFRTINQQIQIVLIPCGHLSVQFVLKRVAIMMWCINLGCTCIANWSDFCWIKILGSKLYWKETLIFSRGGMGTELKRWVSVLWVKVGVLKSYPNRNMKLETRNYPSTTLSFPFSLLQAVSPCRGRLRRWKLSSSRRRWQTPKRPIEDVMRSSEKWWCNGIWEVTCW